MSNSQEQGGKSADLVWLNYKFYKGFHFTLTDRDMLKIASPEEITKFKVIAEEESHRIVSEYNNVLSFFVYGSVARGNPTPSSDIDTITILNCDAKFYDVIKRDDVLISKEFHPKKEYESIDNLTHRIYDAWILYDPEGYLIGQQQKLRDYFYTPKAKQRRIAQRLNLAENDIEKSKSVVADKLSIPIHLRSFAEHTGIILHDLRQKSPSMRRFIYDLKTISQETSLNHFYNNLIDVLGYSNFSEKWMKQSMDGIKHIQKILYSFKMDEEFLHDKQILSPLLVDEYVNGTIELFEAGEYESCLFPCQLYESMILFRRSPALRTFFKNKSKQFETESDKPNYVENLRNLGFSEEFFDWHSKIVGVSAFTDTELMNRIKKAEECLELLKRLITEQL